MLEMSIAGHIQLSDCYLKAHVAYRKDDKSLFPVEIDIIVQYYIEGKVNWRTSSLLLYSTFVVKSVSVFK